MDHPTVLVVCFCLHVYSDQLKPGNDLILYDFCITFFVCYVSDEVVSFSDSIPV